MRIELNQLADDSRIWIFGISPSLDPPKRTRLLQQIDAFLRQWAAHGAPVTSARDVLHDSFLVIAVDRRSETSGCSIDRMFGVLRQLERDLDVAILDPNRIFERAADGAVHAVTRDAFGARGGADTVVFDTLAERLGDVRLGTWQRRAADSWHAKLLPIGRDRHKSSEM